MTNLKSSSGKVKESIQRYFNQSIVIRSYLENDFEATLSSKMNIVNVWEGHFTAFCKFLRDQVDILSRKLKQSVQSYLNQNLVIESFLENGFEATFSSKTNVVSVSKRAFFNFLQIFE